MENIQVHQLLKKLELFCDTVNKYAESIDSGDIFSHQINGLSLDCEYDGSIDGKDVCHGYHEYLFDGYGFRFEFEYATIDSDVELKIKDIPRALQAAQKFFEQGCGKVFVFRNKRNEDYWLEMD